MAQRPYADEELDTLAARIEAWLDRQRADNPVVAAVERDTESGERRWFVRMRGEEKDVFTIWFHLRQRTLAYETYVMPAPEENAAALYEHLLRRNLKLFGASFAIGEEDAVFLVGQIANDAIDDDELDRILGSLYGWTEQYFRPAMRIGFASRFRG
ncbi:MAG TPA: YbjN domain-containing protein [Acidimicrobiales bacterium]|nr:YbjN domain-containing protein [Acidimicrobiales bacterium]